MAVNRIDTVAKRARLEESKKPYFWKVDRGIYLGYRKQPKARKWVVRYADPHAINPKNPYRVETFANVDDEINTGIETLDYKAAKREAEDIAAVRMAEASPAPVVDTVAVVVMDYIAHRERRPGRSGSDARQRLTKHVLSADIAEIILRDVSIAALEEWRDGLKVGDSTKRRLLNDLKAALNLDWDRPRRRRMPADWLKRIKEGLAFVAANNEDDDVVAGVRENQILTDEQVRNVIQAAAEIDADLHRVVIALAVTGMRFSQIARMRVRDLRKPNILMVPVSRKGRSGKQKPITHIRRVISESAFEAIYREGDPDDYLFERNRHVQVSPTEWRVDSRGPWLSSSEMTRPWAVIREKVGLDASIVPYSLRHTAIVRMLTISQKSPLTTAKMFDTSVNIIEKHYGAWAAYADHDEMGIEI